MRIESKSPFSVYGEPQLENPLHRFMSGEATFALQALEVAATQRRIREERAFPGKYRLVIPVALRALSATVMPGLLNDPRLARFAHLEATGPKAERPPADELDAAALDVIADPLSIVKRQRLGALFEARGLDRCASEQYRLTADLG